MSALRQKQTSMHIKAAPGANAGGRRMPREVMSRRFPAPLGLEDYGACFIVKDRDGQALAYAELTIAAQRPRNAALTARARATGEFLEPAPC